MQICFKKSWRKWLLPAFICMPITMLAQTKSAAITSSPSNTGLIVLLLLVLLVILIAVLLLSFEAKGLVAKIRDKKTENNTNQFEKYLKNMNSNQIEKVLKIKHQQTVLNKNAQSSGSIKAILIIFSTILATVFQGHPVYAQTKTTNTGIFSESGILITITLIMIPILAAIVLMIVKLSGLLRKHRNRQDLEEAALFAGYLSTLTTEEATEELKKRKAIWIIILRIGNYQANRNR